MNTKLLLWILGSLIVGICLGWILVPSNTPEYNGVGVPYAEEYDPYIRYNGGFATNLPATFASTSSMTGSTTISGGLKVGSSGTSVNNKVTGVCTVWSSATTIAATSSAAVVCQSATDGSLTSGLTGVNSRAIVDIRMGSSTNTTVGGLIITGNVSASSTPGSILFRLYNATGATFTWTAAASSSSLTNPTWTYTAEDIN